VRANTPLSRGLNTGRLESSWLSRSLFSSDRCPGILFSHLPGQADSLLPLRSSSGFHSESILTLPSRHSRTSLRSWGFFMNTAVLTLWTFLGPFSLRRMFITALSSWIWDRSIWYLDPPPPIFSHFPPGSFFAHTLIFLPRFLLPFAALRRWHPRARDLENCHLGGEGLAISEPGASSNAPGCPSLQHSGQFCRPIKGKESRQPKPFFFFFEILFSK